MDSWPAELVTRLGEVIAGARKARGMSRVKLAEAAEEIDVPVHRVAITRIEGGQQAVTVPELVALGVALDPIGRGG
jgi:ribosome-binding protein aMBF1 (putative translation factor)